jgi:hypothetical protein
MERMRVLKNPPDDISMPIDINGIYFPLVGNLRQDYFHPITETVFRVTLMSKRNSADPSAF